MKNLNKEAVLATFHHIVSLKNISDLPPASYMFAHKGFEYWKGFRTNIVYKVAV